MGATHSWRGLGVNRRQPEIILEHCDRSVAEIKEYRALANRGMSSDMPLSCDQELYGWSGVACC